MLARILPPVKMGSLMAGPIEKRFPAPSVNPAGPVPCRPAAPLSTIFGKNALIHYTNPSIGLKMITLGFVFEAPDATTGVRGYATQKMREDRRHGDWVEVSTTYAIKVVAPLAGYLYLAAAA